MSHYGHNHLQDDWEAAAERDYADRRERAERDAEFYAGLAVKAGVSGSAISTLYDATVQEIMVEGEVSEETGAKWDALIAAQTPQIAEAA